MYEFLNEHGTFFDNNLVIAKKDMIKVEMY